MLRDRLRFTLGASMTALAAGIFGTLALGSTAELSSAQVETDVLIFGWAYGAEVGLVVILAMRWIRHRPQFRIDALISAVFALTALVIGTVEFPIIRNWSFHAHCESLYSPASSEVEPDVAKRCEQYLLHSRLRRQCQRELLRPWANRPPGW